MKKRMVKRMLGAVLASVMLVGTAGADGSCI